MIFLQFEALNRWGANFADTGWLSSVLSVAFWSFAFLGIVVVGGIWLRGVIKYRYYAEVYKRRQENWETKEPESEIVRGKAGYFWKRGRQIFRIKYGMWPWQIIEINKLPDPKYMTSRGREATFLQYNIGEYVQAKKEINWKKGTIDIEAVESTTKAAAKSELKDYQNVFQTSSFLKDYAGPIAMGFIFIAGIVALYFVQQACST